MTSQVDQCKQNIRHIESIQHKVDTNNKVSEVQQELLLLSEEEQTEWLGLHKLIGNKYYRCGNVQKAIEVYMETLTAAKVLKDENTMVTMLCNLASCMISQKQASAAVSILKEVFLVQPGHSRALERRAAAYIEMGMLVEAKADLVNALKNAPDKAMQEKITQVLQKLQVDQRKNKEMYKKMIDDKSNFLLPNWVAKATSILIVPFSWFTRIKSFCCKRKRS